MKNKLIMSFLTFCLVLVTLPMTINATNEAISYNNGCSIESENFVILETYVNEEGDKVILYDNNVEVTYVNDDEILVRDYGHVFSDPTMEPTPASIKDWIKIGKAIFNTLGICDAINYVTGHDVCRIVLNMLTSKPKNVRYELTGRYIPGRVPGCEPMHSLPCNSGYWEYKIIRE